MEIETATKYDVFISYRWVDPDQSWVRNQLAPALTNAGLKVLLDVNDFVPGRDLILEMERAASSSVRAICVISPAYFEGNRMVGFESQMLRKLDPAGMESKLIPFILIPVADMPERLGGLIAVDWTNPDNNQREWKKLLQVLGANRIDIPPPTIELKKPVMQVHLPELETNYRDTKINRVVGRLNGLNKNFLSLPAAESPLKYFLSELRGLFDARNTFFEDLSDCPNEKWTERFCVACITDDLLDIYWPFVRRLKNETHDQLVFSYNNMREELHKYCWALSMLFSEPPTIDDGKNLWLGDNKVLEERLRKKELHKKEISNEIKDRCKTHQGKIQELLKQWPNG
ncbi:MAG: toll/interleukin-1 receptor domain-containing protein [Bacteroidota bacterium]|nr:toll/interleukin-1 receptor domain-containing protein [Bacteroidota bacterium]